MGGDGGREDGVLKKKFGGKGNCLYICTRFLIQNLIYLYMTLQQIVDKLGATVGLGADKLDREVEHAFASDLMSDVLTLKDTPVLITGLCNVQTIRTCDMANLEVVIFVRGKRPSEDMIELADENDMVLICTPYSMFKTCGLLWELGMKPLF